MREAEHVARMEEIRHLCNIFVGKPEEKRPPERRIYRREDNIRMDLGKKMVGMCALHSSGSRYGPVAGSCEHGNEPSGSTNARRVTISFSRMTLLRVVS
jgi:hypothetical protein